MTLINITSLLLGLAIGILWTFVILWVVVRQGIKDSRMKSDQWSAETLEELKNRTRLLEIQNQLLQEIGDQVRLSRNI